MQGRIFPLYRVKELQIQRKESILMDDKQVVELYFARAESAITETDRKYGRYCHSIAYHILDSREDAEEVVNDTYLKTWNTIPPNRPDSLKPYVGMISRQLALDRYEAYHTRKRGGQVPLVPEELSECIPDGDSREDIGESIALRDALNKFVRGLPDRAQRVFIQRYWYTCTVAEIARENGMKESAVGVLLFRTRKKLKLFLHKEGFEL
jgi:RNA polymerase sigma-70 factor (ECF subfamily)